MTQHHDTVGPEKPPGIMSSRSTVDWLLDTLARYLRSEPVGMSAALALVAATLTNSFVAFVVVGIGSLIAAKRIAGEDARRQRRA